MTITRARYLSGGSLDCSFGEGGQVQADGAYGVLSLSVHAADRGSIPGRKQTRDSAG
jgi:hypothetical protein